MTPEAEANLPRHIAVIMDGNNRWAKARDLPSIAGHRAGAEAANAIVDSCLSRDIEFLTLFAFSSENWLRPKKEVQGLMALFLAVLKRKEVQQLHEKNIRLQFIGNRASFSSKLQYHMQEVEDRTRDNSGLTVTVAADYGGRWDITNAARDIARRVAEGELALDKIDEQSIQSSICLGDKPPPDLCIRTAGEHRISNFLLWQFAYTELYFTECFWPDFEDHQLQLALDDYALRQRRFGYHPDQMSAV